MKSMKKSKVIIPALGLLLLSTAASVTGTVAWFTATRTATSNVGDFTVASTTGDLLISGTALSGTTATNTNGVANIAPASNCVLADASVNHTTKQVFYPKDNATAVGVYSQLFDVATGDNYLRQTVGTTKKYSAFTWKYTFTFTPEDGKSVGVFLDYANSSLTDQTSSNDSESWKGFRIGFVSASKSTVWAGCADRTQGTPASGKAQCKYVASTTNMAGTTYSQTQLVASDNPGSVPNDGAATASSVATDTSYPNYLGTFGAVNSTTGEASLEVYCVAWFEGTDPDVVNSANKTFDTVRAVLKFEARNLA